MCSVTGHIIRTDTTDQLVTYVQSLINIDHPDYLWSTNHTRETSSNPLAILAVAHLTALVTLLSCSSLLVLHRVGLSDTRVQHMVNDQRLEDSNVPRPKAVAYFFYQHYIDSTPVSFLLKIRSNLPTLPRQLGFERQMNGSGVSSNKHKERRWRAKAWCPSMRSSIGVIWCTMAETDEVWVLVSQSHMTRTLHILVRERC